jgi:HK97 family phage portal protein
MPNVFAVGNGVKAINLGSLNNWSDLGIMPWGTDGANRNTNELAATVAFMYRSVHLRAAALADVPWAVYRGETALWESDATPPAGMEAFGELEELLYRAEVALCLSSTAYFFKERNRVKVTGLRWLDPTSIEPHWTPAGIDYYKRHVNNAMVRLAPDDVVYIWNRGLSETQPASPPAQAAMNAANALYNTNAFVKAFFERGAIKATLLTVEGTPSREEREKLKSWWERLMGGVKNAFATEVISAAVKPIVVGEGISELSNSSLTQELREDIATALGVPHSLVLSNAATFATAEADRLNFYDTTIIPECNGIARQLNRQLFAPLGLRFAWRPEAMNLYQEDEEQRAGAVAAYVNAGMPLSVAVRLLGIELPEGVQPEDLDPQPQPEQPAPEPVAAAAQDAPAQPARGAQAAEGKAIEAAQFRRWLKRRPDRDIADFEAAYLSPVEIDAIAAEVKGVALEQPPFGLPETFTPESVKALVLRLDPDDDEAEQRIRDALDARSEREIAKALEEWAAQVLPANATVTEVQMAVSQLAAPQRVKDALQRALIAGADLGVSVTVSQLEGVGFGFDWTMVNTHAREWATRYGYDLVSRIEDTTRRGLQEAVTRWVDNGEDLGALRKDLEPLFGRRRAKLIAQTETTRTYAEAALIAQRESGVCDGSLWATANDERLCPVCGALDGQFAPIGGAFPGGLTSPPAHPGCRCFLRPRVRD